MQNDECNEIIGIEKYPRFAAIDIGSNGVRMLVSSIVDESELNKVRKISLVRVPIRLGEDVFVKNKISKKNIELLGQAMKGFRELMKAYEVIDYKACATSAMREASNKEKVVKQVFEKSKVKINIIDGKTEAEILFSTQIAQYLDPLKTYLYIDVGGGSTELTVFADNMMQTSASFNLGTVRMLEGKIASNTWNDFDNFLRIIHNNYADLQLIGVGGNINKLARMAGNKKKVNVSSIVEINEELSKYSIHERIVKLDLSFYRADVIMPAMKIFLRIAEIINATEFNVPQIGIADGIIHLLYDDYKRKL